METLPSKELLSLVLDKCKTPHILEIEGSQLYFYRNIGANISNINIYELMHMMKIWADKEGYLVDSNLGFVSIGKKGNQVQINSFNGHDLRLDETKLVTKACEWILEQEK